MPSVNWDAFSTLPGSAETNFEMLCRGIVRRHYARYGEFRALASQPGVEFHLRLLSKCQLGDAGRWYGWQCRWYDLPGGRTLGNTRRAKIAKALSVTERVLPKLTDWVLLTRRPLTEGDQDWFFAQKTHMQLHLWTAAEVEEHLCGDAEILDWYLEQASERIVELSPRDWRYYRQDIRAAVDRIGWELWEGKSRALDFESLRHHLGDDWRPWHGSVVRLLEQEGVLLRSRRQGLASDEVTVAYDALAGHLVADAVLTRLGRSGFVQWMHEPATVASLTGPFPDRHPLATDITRALVGLMPRRLHRQQLWPLLDEPLRSVALLGSADLEAAYLDSETIRELASLATQSPVDSQQLFGRLLHTRSSPEHPLNSGFLDSMLRPMSVAQRDLHWTEWVRSRSKEVVEDLEYIEKRWHTLAPRSHSDKLRGQWVLWTLTSTAKRIRDQATRTLYWFGRGDAAALFTLALESLSINDPSVSERALAASYGVVMAHQMPDALFEKDLAQFISSLLGSLGTSQSTNPTNNWLLRLYVEGCVELACVYYKGAVAAEQLNGGKFPFASGPAVDRIEMGDPRAAEVDGALSGHYDDDTLSEFIGFRRGAWTAKQEHHVVGHLRGTLWAFGWRNGGLGAIDKNLPREDYHGDRGSVQRYGDKYAWIGLYTYPEMAEHYNRIWDGARPPDVQIDPSFPDPAPRAPFTVPAWVRPTPASDQRWIRRGSVAIPDELFYRNDIGSEQGPWIAACGYLNCESKKPARTVFGFLHALIVDAEDAGRLVKALEVKEYPGNDWLPRVPDTIYTFAGEIPWSSEFNRPPEEEGDSANIYWNTIQTGRGLPIAVEILAHHFGWEGYHSLLNQAGGAYVPSQAFSRYFDLREMPQSFDQVTPDGSKAAVSVAAPEGFGGHLLYLREDLIRRYLGPRKLIWFIWGERNVAYHLYESRPDWLLSAHERHEVIWRRIISAEDLSPALVSRSRRPQKRVQKRPSSRR
jgi:hypothetical protein